MDESDTRRIVIIGKTGAGKSSLGNTIFGEKLFKSVCSGDSATRECIVKTKSVEEQNLTLIDTPGLFDTDRSEEDLKSAILSCLVECSPGPHAFLLVLKVEKFTEHEKAVFDKIQEYFSEDVLKFTTVVFTHGDQLNEGQTIEKFVQQNKSLSDLLKKCGNRCHVIDNKHWNKKDQYRDNQLHVKLLLSTINNMIEKNNGNCFTNELYQGVEEEIQNEEENVRLLPGNLSEGQIREQAKARVFKKLLIRAAAVTTGMLLGALLGPAVMVGAAFTFVKECLFWQNTGKTAGRVAIGFAAGAAVGGGGAMGAAEIGLLTAASAAVGVGAVMGGITGYQAAEGANTAHEAAQRAADDVIDGAMSFFRKAHNILDKKSQ